VDGSKTETFAIKACIREHRQKMSQVRKCRHCIKLLAHLIQDFKLIKACKNDTKNLNILNVALYVINNTHCKYSLPLSNMFTDIDCCTVHFI